MSEFTKGPWRYSETHSNIISTTGVYRDIICDVEPGISSRLLPSRANARLIAAAPDLYAVLERLEESVEYWSEYDVPLGIVDDIKAALAKARGEL